MAPTTLCGCLPARVALALLCSSGVIALYLVRINLSVAIVAMVHVPSTKNVTRDKLCINNREELSSIDMVQGPSNSSYEIMSSGLQEEQIPDKIIMTSMEKGSILGAFFYGYFTTGIIGGRMAELYGTKRVYGISMLMGAILTFLTPLAAKTHYAFFTTVRILMGMLQGVVYPAMHSLISRWIPPLERPRFISFVYVSNCLGVVITLPLCGVIIEAVGWEWAFYVPGIVSVVWVVMWALLMHDTPQQHPRISQAELKYITDKLTQQSGGGTKPTSIPWKKILSCKGLWAIAIAHAGNMYGFNLLNTQLPSFMDGVLGLSIKKNALLSSIPFLSRFIGSNCWSWFGDMLNTKGFLSIYVSRRLFSAIGMVGNGIVLAIVGFVGCNEMLVVSLLALGTFCMGATNAGYASNDLDLAPNFAGTLFGLTNSFGFGFAMLAPVVVGALTPDQTPEQWQAAFLSTSGLLILCVTVYLIFADTEIKPWNFASPKEAQDEKEEEERQEFIQKHSHGSAVSLQKL
ncbi:unnamed protein product [Meganyctiphanes norvegica]|uniref:Major facilitator superfamily (MFS) profile domain-containing protein n=1 Tax=Meganyctiphanes norvegica TaxID=48144 RepID=A0AAV2R201_MEGNR